MVYDGLGRLHKDTDDATGGSTLLDRNDSSQSFKVTLTTALNRIKTHQLDYLTSGDEQRLITFTDGAHTELLTSTDGSRKTTSADGTIISVRESPDPRFGMNAPVPHDVSVITGGVTCNIETERRSKGSLTKG